MQKKSFFGWWVLLGLCLIYGASNGILVNTLPMLYPQQIEEFGWDPEQVTRPATFLFLVIAFLSPFGGALLDKFSPRQLMIYGAILLVIGLGLYPFISSLWQMTVLYQLFAVGIVAVGLVPSMILVTRWFVKYRGIAVGLLLMSSSLGGAIFPLLVKGALVDEGWRAAMMILAVVGAVMMIVPLFLWVRNSPQDLGLHADGADNDSVVEADNSQAGPSLKEALHSPVFYLLAFSTATMWFCILGVLQHQAIYLSQDIGIDKAAIPGIFSLFFWCAIVGKFGFGYLSDHFDKGKIMLLSIINLALGLLMLRLIDQGGMTMVYIYAVIYGVGYSGAFTMVQLSIAEFFAGQSYGKILGIFTFVDTIAGTSAIAALGFIRSTYGSYLPAFDFMMGICGLAAICIIVINRIKP
ncbi:MFS transporter [Oceanicoccus sagamiensis]|uniref:Major facilitator superfamily (MFS) profile domain-containing protein n=1 Tax=Oceanicoccus sagamiensis TaxID=716816 RepID=A0A1X9NHQ0_9GAMM|nr:MFS transporter [Oceanicoccus sagamiensis]ARN73513.1 hypothetical protein BST96_04900 [Oceanicoccus sagamiensis]